MTATIRKTTAAAAFASAVLLASLSGAAGAQPAGEGPLVLRLPAGARAASLANAALTLNDADVLMYNPGMLSVARGGNSISIQRYGSFGTTGSMAAIVTSGSLFIGVGAQFLEWSAPSGVSYGEAVRPGATRLSDSGGVASSSSAFTVGVSRTIKGVRFGASAKYVDERFGLDHGGTAAFDLGVIRSLGRANLAFVVQNLGGSANVAGEKGPLPRRIGIGYGGGPFPVGVHWDVGMQTQLTLEGDLFLRPAGGIEVGYVPIDGVSILFRTGFRLPREKSESLVTGGLGISYDRFSLDYAAEPFRDGRPVSHRVGFRIR